MITGTFEYGKLFSKASIVVLAILAGASIAAVVGMICAYNEFSKEDFAFIFIYLLIMCISFSAFLIYIVIFNKYHKKKIEEWKQDAILTEGIVERLPGLLSNRSFNVTVMYKKGKRMVRFPSENRTKFPIRRTRYFDSLVGIKMPMLYSPQYNKIMFIDTFCADYVS